MLADAIADRLGLAPEQDLRPTLLAGIANSILRVAVVHWSTDGQQALSDVISSAFDLLEQGLFTSLGTDIT